MTVSTTKRRHAACTAAWVRGRGRGRGKVRRRVRVWVWVWVWVRG